MIKVCFIITFAIAYIYHLDAPNQIASEIARWLSNGKFTKIQLRKPLGCPLCMTFWVTFILLLFVNPSLCWIAFIFAFASKYMDYAISLVENILDTFFILCERIIQKLKM